MSEILIKDFSKVVKRSFSVSVNQGRFMREVFKAAGYDRFPTTSDENYAKKICDGSKPITPDMKNGFPKPYHVEELALYFVKKIDNVKVKTLATFFGITDDTIDNCIRKKQEDEKGCRLQLLLQKRLNVCYQCLCNQ